MNNINKKKLSASTSLGPGNITNQQHQSGFLQKTLNHLPIFFTNQTHSPTEEQQPVQRTSSASPKHDYFKLKFKTISPSISPSSSPPISKSAQTPSIKKLDQFLFESDPNTDESPLTPTETYSPKLVPFKVQQKKLKHQAFSLSSAFSSLTTSSLLIPQLASSNTITNSLLQTPLSEKTVSTTKLGNSKQTTTVDTLTSRTTLHNSGLFINRSNNGLNKNGKTNYKDHVNTKNVRRRSSTLNANMCFLSNRHNNSTLHDCAYATNQFLKALDKMNSNSNSATDLNSTHHQSNESLKTVSNRISVNSNIGILVGASDIKFRKKLLKLQQRQQDFIYAASTYLPTGLERRKKAFAADNLSYTEYDESEEFLQDNSKMVRRLSRAVSVIVSSVGFCHFDFVEYK